MVFDLQPSPHIFTAKRLIIKRKKEKKKKKSRVKLTKDGLEEVPDGAVGFETLVALADDNGGRDCFRDKS
jgi:hypothetical protein